MVERSISSAGNQLVVSVNLVKAALPSWPSSYPLTPFLQSLGKVSVVTVSILTTKKLCSIQAGQLLTTVNREEPRALGSQRKLRAVVGSLNDSISVTRELVRSIEVLTQNLGVGPAFRVLRSLRVVVRPALGKGLGWALQPPALQLVWRIGTKLEEPGRQMPRWM